ncbi:MAG TPA: enoyl-CoA hydratase-related protein [Actinomycetota bacterium]|nr:enoyl-CoA hydratase-related protein [Actinomycetota bacterium]
MISFSTDERGVARLALNRPDVRNAFNDELIAAVTDTVRDLDPSVRVLVLSGEGKVFCAGADLNWMRGMAGYSLDENRADSTRLRTMFEALDECPVPVVGRVHGAAMAGATGLVACCDVAVAAEDTVFAFTEVRLGLVPAVISPFVVRKVGYAFARSMFLTAERFDADRAYEAGLVHRVVPPEELDATVEEYVEAFLAAAPGALRETRRLLEQVVGRQPEDVRELTVQAISEARVGEEGQEGVVAFFEKRPPSWAPQR